MTVQPNHNAGRSHAKRGKAPPANNLQLKITLRYIEPPIWRRVLVPDDFTLGQLHQVIQSVMGWACCHLHAFRVPARGFGLPPRTWDEGGEQGEDEDDTLLREVFERKGQKLLYEYDFGDGWLHEIKFERVLAPEPGKRYPVCVKGARACPPEDCGGPPGYDRLVHALCNPKDKDSAEVLEWAGPFDPEAFDLNSVNRLLVR